MSKTRALQCTSSGRSANVQCSAIFLQEGPEEGVVVSFAGPSLERWQVNDVMGTAGEYMRACLRCAFVTVGAKGFDVWEAVSSIGVVLSNGRMACEGPGYPGELLGVVVGHVKEMVFGTLVLNRGLERLPFSSHIEPVTAPVGWKAVERLPLFVCLV